MPPTSCMLPDSPDVHQIQGMMMLTHRRTSAPSKVRQNFLSRLVLSIC